jgi:RNA polymerase sigma-70 factor (ECF subfamily)
MSPAPSAPTRRIDDRTVDRAFKRSNALRWNLGRARFALALERSVASRFATETCTPALVSEYIDSLNLEELALACACSEGQVSAWAYFIECHRPGLRAAARAIVGDDEGSELADSLYAELYGLEERDGRRRSLFDYFHGRSRLSTWLRSILAQRHVDRIRAARKTRQLDEEDEALPDRPAAVAVEEQPDRLRFARLAQRALGAAILGLDPAERLRLSFYYLQRLTLAQIGRLTGEHEATVSRRLDRIRRSLRADLERRLREEDGLGEAAVRACMECALEDVGLDLEQWLGHPDAKPGGEQETVRRSF